jgi:hypothetical protein
MALLPDRFRIRVASLFVRFPRVQYCGWIWRFLKAIDLDLAAAN